MRVVFLSHLDANLYLFRLPVMKAMAAMDWEVIALCPEGNYSPLFEAEGIRHTAYPIDRGSLNPFKELRTLFAIAEKLKVITPDILHTFTVKPNIYGNLAARLAKTPVIVSSVTGLGSFFIEPGTKAALIRHIITLLYRIVFRRVDAVVFQNSDDRQLFIGQGIVSREKTHLIKGSGIDTTLWQKKESEVKSPPRILFVGRLLIHKGIREFIAAARIVREHFPAARFVVAGDFDPGNGYSMPKETFQEAVDEGVIEFLGWRTDIRELLQETTLFVLPSYREGLPRTAIEAASMGIPIVTTDAVGCKESVADGVTGFLVRVGDHKQLAERILYLLDNPGVYAKFSLQARKKAVAEFDVKSIVQGHLALYDSLLKR
jgi:N,N'-diacetylbacillosaminyl-diphospho-undecaprenol alpha-1,3-N-acetylgalactosaminyltransferase